MDSSNCVFAMYIGCSSAYSFYGLNLNDQNNLLHMHIDSSLRSGWDVIEKRFFQEENFRWKVHFFPACHAVGIDYCVIFRYSYCNGIDCFGL